MKVFGPLPDETLVYPGHGDDITRGVERATGHLACPRLVSTTGALW